MGCGSSKATPVVQEPTPQTAPEEGEKKAKKSERKNDEVKIRSKVLKEKKKEIEEGIQKTFGFADFPTPRRLRGANKRYGKGNPTIELDENNVIKPFPVSKFKKKILSKKGFELIDPFAISTPAPLLEAPLSELVQHVTKHFKDQLQKARALFRWLSVQHTMEIDVDRDMPKDTAYYWLQRMERKYAGYDHIFLQLCKTVGISCTLVEGYVKGETYELGEEINEKHKSSWSLVLLDGCWRQIDVEWAMRGVTGGGSGDWILLDDNGQLVQNPQKSSEDTEKSLLYRIDESAFLPDPHEFIYSHFPTTGEEWQLLARPVTHLEFIEMAQLKPAFFELGMKVGNQPRCVVEAMDGECDLDFGLPMGKGRKFVYRLWISSQDGREERINGTSLDRFVYMEQSPDTLSCRIQFPVQGSFKFELFGRASEPDEMQESQQLSLVCVYKIHCETANQEIQALPQNQGKVWGPGEDLEKAGIQPITHNEGTVDAEDGTVQMEFKTHKEVEILAKLHSNDRSEEELKNFVLHQQVGDQLVINAKVPEAGDYALDLYAKEQGADGKLSHVCSYLVRSDAAALDPSPYAEVMNGALGGIEKEGVKVVPKSHQSALIKAPEKGELVITMETPVPCDLLAKLELQTENGSEEKTNQTFIEKSDAEANIKVRAPDAGNYVLNIYGKEAGKEGTFPLIYTYAIEADFPSENPMHFPDSFAPWSTGCELSSPTNGALKANQSVPFSVKVPGAEKVAVISQDSELTQLVKGKDEFWYGEVKTGEAGRQLQIGANYEADGESYSILLKFQVEEDSALKKLEKEQENAIQKAQAKRDKQVEEQRRREEEFKKAKKKLLKAVEDRQIKELQSAIRLVEQKRYKGRLKEKYEEAKTLLQSLKRIEKLQHSVMNMDAATMAEVKNYPNPPPGVHDVMIATTLLLGHAEKHSRDWNSCQKLLKNTGKNSLNRSITKFDVRSIDATISSRAKEILGKYRLGDVRDKSAGAATFYQWVQGMIEEWQVLKANSSV